MPLDDDFHKACAIYENTVSEADRLKFGAPSPNDSEVNVVGYYRLKDKKGNVLLRLKILEIYKQYGLIGEKLQRAEADAKQRLETASQADAIRNMHQKLRSGEELELIGGFHKGSAKLVYDKIYLYYKITNALGQNPGIVEEIPCSALSIEVLTEDNRASVMGRVFKGAVWGLGLGILSGGLGVLGALGGVMSGRTKKIIIVATLKDGRSMLIDTHFENYKKLLVLSHGAL